jgi:N-acetylglucosaminyldiphosphoundecaprenol N-acetyl-beta-D-mannosaminyltransferase
MAMKLRENIKGVPVDLVTNNELLGIVTDWLAEQGQPRQVVTLNAAILIASLKNSHLKKVICEADLVTVDGYGIGLALARMGYRNWQRFTGVDLVREMLSFCARNNRSVYFYGGSLKTVTALQQNLPVRWPGLIISGIRDGYQSLPQTEIIAEIGRLQPDLILVGLGSPKQELFLAELLPHLKKTVGVGVGGAFEILAGTKREAPPFIRNHGFEWLYRMFQDPRRIRLIPDLIKFWFLVILNEG